MGSIRDIEQAIRNRLNVAAGPALHDRVLVRVRQAAEPSEMTPALRGPAVRRKIMRNRCVKLAAMIPLIVGIVVVWSLLSESADPASVALARVKEALLSQPWIHVTYDNGREEWQDLRGGTYACVSEHGWRSFVDHARNIRQEHSRDRDYVLETTPKVYPEGQIPPWEPQIVWEAVRSFCADENAKALGQYTQIVSSLDTRDGQEVIRLDIYYLDSLDNRVLITQIWTDPQSRLPQRIRHRLPSPVQERDGIEFITGTCDFPATGPASIFDLGVERGLRLVRQVDPAEAVASETQRVLRESEKAALSFPKHYRAVAWYRREPNEVGPIQILYRSGEQLRASTYFNVEATKYPDCHLSLPATPAQVVAWAETQVPIEVGIYDGVNVFRRSNVHPHGKVNDRTSAEVRRVSIDHVPNWFYLESDLWRHLHDKAQNLQVVANRPETPPGCVTLRGGNVYYFLDPLKDYICVRTIYMTAADGNGRFASETSLSDFAQLPSGQWYARKRLVTIRPDLRLRRKEPPMENEANICLQILPPKDLPAELFDGQKLLEGAEVKTY
jgi:hypothetical protein